MSGSASSASYEPWARAMPSCGRRGLAGANDRDEIAVDPAPRRLRDARDHLREPDLRRRQHTDPQHVNSLLPVASQLRLHGRGNRTGDHRGRQPVVGLVTDTTRSSTTRRSPASTRSPARSAPRHHRIGVGGDLVLHLHRLHHHQQRAVGDGLAGLDVNRYDPARQRRHRPAPRLVGLVVGEPQRAHPRQRAPRRRRERAVAIERHLDRTPHTVELEHLPVVGAFEEPHRDDASIVGGQRAVALRHRSRARPAPSRRHPPRRTRPRATRRRAATCAAGPACAGSASPTARSP